MDAGYKTGSKHHYRQRCHALLLSHTRHTIGEISRLLNRRQETIRAWMNAFGKLGLGGLGIAFGRGRKAIIRIGEQTTETSLERCQKRLFKKCIFVSLQKGVKKSLKFRKRIPTFAA